MVLIKSMNYSGFHIISQTNLKNHQEYFFDILLLMLGVMVKRFPLVPLHQAELKNAYL